MAFAYIKKAIAKFHLLLVIILLHGSTIFAATIQKKPISTVYTPDSILNHKEQYVAATVGAKKRHATSTAAAWFHKNYIVSLNLYGEKMLVYHFNEATKQFSIVQQINNQQGAKLRHPEHLSMHPSGKLLAVCNATGSTVALYSVDLDTHLINPTPLYSVFSNDLIHNARFTADGNYLAYVSFDNNKALCIYKVIQTQNDVILEPVYQKPNELKLVKSKAIQFTQDGKYAIIAYALPIHLTVHSAFKSILVSYKFNKNGTLGPIVSQVEGCFSIEDLALLDNDRAIVATDQANDALVVYPFDPQTGAFSNNYTSIGNPEAQLSFPHGMGLSPDGNYLVVCNYGDDTFNMYQVD